MNINPMQIIQLIKGGSNPQQLLMNILQNNKNIPIYQNVMNLMQNNNISGLQQIGRNLAQQRGIDFDEAFSQFKNSLR